MRKIFTNRRRYAVIFLLMLFLSALLYGFVNFNRALLSAAEARAGQQAVLQISRAFTDAFSEELTYDDYMTVTYDGQGGISMLTANVTLMNRLASDAAALAQENITALSETGVSVPAGTALGIPALSGVGPRVRFRIEPIGTVVTRFETEFESAGINQTRHRISLAADATLRIVVPTGVRKIEVSTSAIMAESILVGDVPSSYIEVTDVDEALNFMP